jgi:putative redox protein
MVEIEVIYAGKLHTEAVHGPSGARVATDAPVDNHGLGACFSPTDMVAGALGACMLTVMGILAEKNGWNIDGARVSVEKHMVVEPKRRIGQLVVELAMPAGVPDDARLPLELAAFSCPVRESLNPAIKLDVCFDWTAG